MDGGGGAGAEGWRQRSGEVGGGEGGIGEVVSVCGGVGVAGVGEGDSFGGGVGGLFDFNRGLYFCPLRCFAFLSFM